nr:SNF1-related protein kinase regulatory subunit gamma-like PV42a [Ipomoea batatas]
MQATRESHSHEAQPKRLAEKKVMDLMHDKRRLVEVPYTATLAGAMNTLLANRVAAVPVAAPPGQWIGAGGSMILEYDKRSGAARKHYIGMVTMLDILAHIAGDGEDDVDHLDQKLATPVSSIIGHCLESLSLWTLNPSMSLVDCMEVFSKGIHRAMVPIEGQAETIAGVELVESASSYRMLTQMDVLKFVMREHDNQNEEVKGIMSHHIKDSKQFQAVTDTVFGVTDQATVIDAIKCMRAASLNAVPIVQSSNTIQEDHRQLVNGKKRKVIATFSATDLRGCPVSLLESCLNWKVIDLLSKLSESSSPETAGVRSSLKEIVACNTEFTVGEAVEKAVRNGVHRVWVVDGGGLLQGVFSLTDMIRVIRLWMLSQPLRS